MLSRAMIVVSLTLVATAAGAANPVSSAPSNGSEANTRSTIAPQLPPPAVGDNAPPEGFLRAARGALASGRTGEAQEALERAESRALDRSVRPSQAGAPSRQSLVSQIAAARDALSAGDRVRALQLTDDALRNPEARDQPR